MNFRKKFEKESARIVMTFGEDNNQIDSLSMTVHFSGVGKKNDFQTFTYKKLNAQEYELSVYSSDTMGNNIGKPHPMDGIHIVKSGEVRKHFYNVVDTDNVTYFEMSYSDINTKTVFTEAKAKMEALKMKDNIKLKYYNDETKRNLTDLITETNKNTEQKVTFSGISNTGPGNSK